MSKSTRSSVSTPGNNTVDSVDPEVMQFRAQFEGRSPLDEIVRHGAQQMLQAAIDQKVADFIALHSDRRDDQGRRQVVRNGYLPSREPARWKCANRASAITRPKEHKGAEHKGVRNEWHCRLAGEELGRGG